MTHPTLPSEQVIETLNWRYATKKFDPQRKIPDADWKALEQSLVLSPSSFGLQPWKFFVIRNADLRHQLLPHSWNQSQITDASHLVVLTIKKGIDNSDVARYIERMADVQSTKKENLQGLENAIAGFLQDPPFPLDVDQWSIRQTYIALGFFMYSAAVMGIDACPIEGFMPAKYDEVLGLPAQGYTAAVLCAAGYRAADDNAADRPKVRYEAEAVVAYID